MQQHIKKILFPTDFSAMAVMGYKYCLELAKAWNASVHVLHVYRADLSVPVPNAVGHKLIDERRRNTQLKLGQFTYLKNNGDASLLEGVEVHAHAAAGLPEDEIAAFSKRNEIDLIVMPTKGEHNILEVLFGSITTATMGKAKCPVLVIPEGASYSAFKNVAYAVDFNWENVNHAVVPVDLAKFYDATLHYVHVYQEEGENQSFRKIFSNQSESVNAKFHELKGNSVQGRMKSFMKTENIDLLVTYSPPKNFLERLFRWSTTRHIVENITVPLLVIR